MGTGIEIESIDFSVRSTPKSPSLLTDYCTLPLQTRTSAHGGVWSIMTATPADVFRER